MKSALGISFVAITILGLMLSPTVTSINADSHAIMSPRKQMANGVAAEDVECREGLVLMIRATNGAAACVKSTTSMKLSDAGWGEVIETAEKMMEEEEHMEEEHMEEEMMEEMMEETTEEMMEETTEEMMEEESTEKKVTLEEDLSLGEQDGIPPEIPEEEPFSIGGIDLSMAAPVEGDADAPITIIEFGDYQCPKCQDWFINEKSTIESNYISQGIAKLYFLDSAWLGDDSVSAAQAAYCADDQGKFSEFHSTLYTNQADIESGWANPSALKQFAMDMGLDSETFDECLDSGKYADRVTYNTDVGAANGVDGTPYFFVISEEGETKIIAGPQPAVVFDAAILSLGY